MGWVGRGGALDMGSAPLYIVTSSGSATGHWVIGLNAYTSALYICISVTNRYGTGGRRQAHGLVYGCLAYDWYRNVLCMHA